MVELNLQVPHQKYLFVQFDKTASEFAIYFIHNDLFAILIGDYESGKEKLA